MCDRNDSLLIYWDLVLVICLIEAGTIYMTELAR